MGLIRTTITLTNPRRDDLQPVEVEALVDSGALPLCIPEHVALQLQLDEFDRREVTVADGSRHVVSYMGPVATACGRRRGLGGAMVLGQDVLLGAIPMEDMDLIVRPSTREVVPNPARTNIPASIAMGVRHPRNPA